MVVVEQIQALLDFLEERPDLALGNMSRTKEGRSLAKHLWIECAQILNKVTQTCPQKTPENWRMFYNEYKSKLLKKVKTRKSDNHTGGQTNTNTLTPLQKRLYLMLGLDFGEPLLGGTYDPHYQDSENGIGEDSSHNSNHYNSASRYFDTVANAMIAGRLSPYDAEAQFTVFIPSTDNGVVKPKDEDKYKIEIVYDDQVSPCSSPNADQSQCVPLDDEVPRKRRRSRNNVKREHAEGQDKTVLEALKRLKRLESATGKAIQKQARATNRLAAAIESISDRLSKPLVVLVKEPSRKKKRYCRILISSESEADDSSSGCSEDRQTLIPSKSKSSANDYSITSREPSIK